MTIVQAHLLCLVLFGVDLVARAYRIQWYLRGLGSPLQLRQAFELNAWGDAAAGLSPMRAGGEAARLAGLLRAGVPATRSFLAIGLEVVVAYPLVLLVGGVLAWRFAPRWWEHAGPLLGGSLERRWPWVAGAATLTLLVWLGVWRWKHLGLREPRRGRERVRRARQTLPWGAIALGIPTSLANVGCRLLMLPVLALTLPDHPPLGVLLFGSFVLLYSQLVLPTPAGAGVVELGFLGGIAGNLQGAGGELLIAWRLYTVGGGVLLGALLAAHTFGFRPLLAVLRRALRPPGR